MFAKYNQTAFDQLQFNHNLLAALSQTTIMVHSRDDEGVGMNHKVILPKSSHNFIDNDGAGKTKSKQAFWSTLTAFKKFLWNFLLKAMTDFSRIQRVNLLIVKKN